MNPADKIRSLPNDLARAQYCQSISEQLRADYFQGQRESIMATKARWERSHRKSMLSLKSRYDVEETGKIRWSTSATAKGIASDEQMYARWAMMYYAAHQAKGGR